MAFGTLLTISVQSSSITTSTIVPLAGAGVLSLRQIFPFTLGANIGTTVTAMMAALTLNSYALVAAFSHLLFNISGILLGVKYCNTSSNIGNINKKHTAYFQCVCLNG